jgi:hypothetical protein
MAIVKLKEVTVTRLNNTGNGVKVTESNESNGKTYKMQFTCWFDSPSGLAEGDIVSLSGFLSAKVGDPWQGSDGQERRSVEYSINKPRIDTAEGTSGTTGATTAEPWATSAPVQTDSTQGYTDEVPF